MGSSFNMDGSLDDLIKKDKEDRPRGKGQGDKEPPSKESLLNSSLDDISAANRKQHKSGGPQRRNNSRNDRRFDGGYGGGQRGGNDDRGGRKGGKGKGKAPRSTGFKKFETCAQNENGDVVIKLYETEIVTVDPAGNFTLNAGGFRTSMTLEAMNSALAPFRLKVTAPNGFDEDWNVSDGKRFMQRVQDGVKLPPVGNVDPKVRANRGKLLLMNKEQGRC